VVKHLSPPYADRLLTHPDLIQMARQTHFRPFNGHHCQIPATDGKGHETLEIKPYFEFVDAFFACWLRGAKGGEVLYACPEYGMREGVYGLYCFPNVWKDTIYVHGKICSSGVTKTGDLSAEGFMSRAGCGNELVERVGFGLSRSCFPI